MRILYLIFLIINLVAVILALNSGKVTWITWFNTAGAGMLFGFLIYE